MRHPAIPTAAKQIGKGAFSTAYAIGNDIFIDSCDPAKECMALGWFPNHPMFPKVERLEITDRGGIYKMPRYEKLWGNTSQLTKSEVKFLKELRAAWEHFRGLRCKHWNDRGRDNNSYEYAIAAAKHISSRTKRAAFIEAVEAMTNYGSDVGFECPNANLAIKGGRLILLDCFFMVSKLEETRRKK